MANTVACNSCEIVLDEDPDLPSEKRKPCSNCGSTARKFFVSVQGTVSFESLLTVTSSAGEKVISSTNLLLQTVIVSGEETAEGRLIEAVAFPWFDIIELLKNDPDMAYRISDRQWEEMVAGAYKKAGFDEVTLTPRSGDHGRDVIAVKRGIGVIRVIDQVKAYKPGHLVKANDVRALVGVLFGDGASKGFLTTTSDFAPKIREDPLIAPFMPSRLELINGKALLKRLEELARKTRR